MGLVGCLHLMVLLYHIAVSVLQVKGILLEGYVMNSQVHALNNLYTSLL